MQGRFDGLEIDSHQARFTGTFDLDEGDIAGLELDRVAFFVVAVRVEGATLKTTSEADVKRINVLKVQDARIARDQLRTEAVNWLAGKNNQGTLDFAERNGLATAEQKAEELEFVARQGVHVDPETGEISTSVGEESLERPAQGPDLVPSVPTDVEVIAPPYRSPAESNVPEMPIDRPKVGKFDPETFNGSSEIGEVEQVGSVYAGGRKDSRLAKFMEAGE